MWECFLAHSDSRLHRCPQNHPPQPCVSHRHVTQVCMTNVTQKCQAKRMSCCFRATETETPTGEKCRHFDKPATEKWSPKKLRSKHSPKNSRVESKPPPRHLLFHSSEARRLSCCTVWSDQGQLPGLSSRGSDTMNTLSHTQAYLFLLNYSPP